MNDAARPNRRSMLLGSFAAGGAMGWAAPQPTSMASAAYEAGDAMLAKNFGISVRAHGVVGDGRSEDTRAIQAAYDALVARGGGTLFFPAGTYATSLLLSSRAVAIAGDGPAATRLIPAGRGDPILRAGFSDSRWELVSISGVTLDGRGAAGSRGFVFGDDDRAGLSPFTGRVAFDRVGFTGLDRAVVRPSGNIGVFIDRCTFGSIGIAIECRSIGPGKTEMHAGTMKIARSHFSDFDAAAILVDNRVPGGQVTIEDCVFENARGFLLYIPAFNAAGPTPGIALRRCWIENVATGAAVIDGQRHNTACCIWARDCSCPILVEDSPIGTVDLRGTTLITDNCALDGLNGATLDAASQLIHHQARQFSGQAPGRCASIVGPSAATGLRTPWFRMSLPTTATAVPALNRLMVATDTASLALAGATLRGGTRSGEHPGVDGFNGSTALNISARETFFHQPLTPVADRSFIVALYLYRLASGAAPGLEINGSRGLSGRASLGDDAWQLLANISRCTGGTAPSQGLMVSGGDRDATILVAGAALISFPKMAQAVAFVNAGAFPR